MHRAATAVLALLLSCVLLSGVAAAQATARNTVTVRIPTVLRLRVDASTVRDAKQVDFTWSAKNRTLTPDSVEVRIFANSHWTLSVQELDAGPNLEYRHPGDAGSSWRDPMQDSEVTSQGPTGGWLAYRLDFRVRPSEIDTTPDGTRTVLFTLTRP
jgi:hypothetical protein